jgi:hypothetical protein
VVGARTVETRTSEVATNVTEEQMRSLPQPDRNFLNFAGLAPGITVSHNETNKQITAGGPAGDEDQRVHRWRELQERHSRGRRARPGCEPRQSVPADRAAGVPRHHAELQGGVPARGERDRDGDDEERHERVRAQRLRAGQNKDLVEQNPGLRQLRGS